MFATLLVAAASTSALMLDSGHAVYPLNTSSTIAILGLAVDYPQLGQASGSAFIPATIDGTIQADRDSLQLSWDEIQVRFADEHPFGQLRFPIFFEGQWQDAFLRITVRDGGSMRLAPYSTQLVPNLPGTLRAHPSDDVYPSFLGGEAITFDWELVGPETTLSGSGELPFGEVRLSVNPEPWLFEVPLAGLPSENGWVGWTHFSSRHPSTRPILYEGPLDGTTVRVSATSGYVFSFIPEPSGLALGLVGASLLLGLRHARRNHATMQPL